MKERENEGEKKRVKHKIPKVNGTNSHAPNTPTDTDSNETQTKGKVSLIPYLSFDLFLCFSFRVSRGFI